MVNTYLRDKKSGEILMSHFPEENGAYMAGLENYRTDVWGTDAARKRGAKFLPMLAEYDLYIDNEELNAFETECWNLLADLPAFTTEICGVFNADRGVPLFQNYLENFIKAIDHARSLGEGGGVYIG